MRYYLSRRKVAFAASCVFAAVCAVAFTAYIWTGDDVLESRPAVGAVGAADVAGLFNPVPLKRTINSDPAPSRFEAAQIAQPSTSATWAASPFSGGASSLNETYKDWQVICASQGTVKRCVLSQIQTQPNGQRVLAVELTASAGNNATGVLLLPLGLSIEKGVTLQIEDKPASQSRRLRTCVPAGCLVMLSFDPTMVAALRAGTMLKIKTLSNNGNEMQFSIP